MNEMQKVRVEMEIQHAKKEIEIWIAYSIGDKSYANGRIMGLQDKIEFLEKLLKHE